jgi:hypothetical protein
MRRAVLRLSLLAAVTVSVSGAFADDTDWQAGWRRITGQNGMAVLPQDLSVADVRHMLGHYLEWEYRGQLRLGIVSEQDEDTIVAEFVTPDSYLVQRVEVNRHTGWMRPRADCRAGRHSRNFVPTSAADFTIAADL